MDITSAKQDGRNGGHNSLSSRFLRAFSFHTRPASTASEAIAVPGDDVRSSLSDPNIPALGYLVTSPLSVASNGAIEIPGFYDPDDYTHCLPNAVFGTDPGTLHLVAWPSWFDLDPMLDVRVGLGSGQYRSPFSCGQDIFDKIVKDFQFSAQILSRVKEKQSYFEHVFIGGESPTHLEITASTYEHDSFFCLIRYEILTRRTRCLVFLKSFDQLKKSSLTLPTIMSYLDAHKETLQPQPLLIFNVILSLLQSRSHDFLRWRQQLYDIEARIGVSSNLNSLRKSKYSEVEYDFSKLNADLTGVARNIADNELSVSTITRAEMYLKHTKMTQDVLQSLTAALYNRINKSDTRSMKTIAVATLFFLPATFVSAIFSTGIFNFQAGENPGEERVISKYGWVYLVVSLVLTALTLVVWTVLFLWGEMWLDNMREKRNKGKPYRVVSDPLSRSAGNNGDETSDDSIRVG
jgi:hypothetical protein